MGFVHCKRGVISCELRRGASRSQAPALLLLNALGTTYRIWDGVLDTLEFRGPVLRYDMRGHGLSEVGESPYSIEALAEDALELLGTFGLESVVVCGLSVGGLVAQELAAAQPSRVRGAILCGTAARIGSEQGWQARIEQVRAGGVEAVAEVVLERWFGPGYRARCPEGVRGHRCMLERTPRQGYLATVHALSRADQTQRSSQIQCPVLVVSGELDAVTTPADGQRLAALIPGARFAQLAGAAHLLSVEQPRELAASIDAFAKEHGLG